MRLKPKGYGRRYLHQAPKYTIKIKAECGDWDQVSQALEAADRLGDK